MKQSKRATLLLRALNRAEGAIAEAQHIAKASDAEIRSVRLPSLKERIDEIRAKRDQARRGEEARQEVIAEERAKIAAWRKAKKDLARKSKPKTR